MSIRRTLGILAATPLLFVATEAGANERLYRPKPKPRCVETSHGNSHYHRNSRVGRTRGHRSQGVRSVRDRRARRTVCRCSQRWVAGHYRVETVKVRQPGCYQRVWVPARYRTRVVCGVSVKVKISRGRYERTYVPGRLKAVQRKVWVPGRHVVDRCRAHRVGHRG